MHRPSKQSNLFQSNGEEQQRKMEDEIKSNTAIIIIIIISRGQRADVGGGKDRYNYQNRLPQQNLSMHLKSTKFYHRQVLKRKINLFVCT